MRISGTSSYASFNRPLTQVGSKKPAPATQSPESHKAPAVEMSIPESVTISITGTDKNARNEKELTAIENEIQWLNQQLDSINQQGEAQADAMRVKLKCLLIASRIMQGDKVPNADYQYLAKNDLELFKMATMLRVTKANPINHKRLSEDDQDDKSASEGKSATNGATQPANNEMAKETSDDPQ